MRVIAKEKEAGQLSSHKTRAKPIRKQTHNSHSLHYSILFAINTSAGCPLRQLLWPMVEICKHGYRVYCPTTSIILAITTLPRLPGHVGMYVSGRFTSIMCFCFLWDENGARQTVEA